MPNESLERVASKILTYTDTKYNEEYPSSHKYTIPTRLKQLERRLAGFGDDDSVYDIDTESVHEYLDRLGDDDLFTSSAFLGHLLNPPVNRLVIPDYQRDYSWKETNNQRYWIDIKSLLHSIDDDGSTQREKYMGSAYISDESDNLEIIDGQQRVTTSLLLLLNIKRYLDLLEPHVSESNDDDFKHFFDHFIGSDHLEQMLYPSGGEPALEPNESDESYFNAIFAKEPLILEQHLEDIGTAEGPGGVIGDEKLLRKELGYAPHEVEDLSPVPDGQNFVQKQSNRLLREAFTFYREKVGELVSQQHVLSESRDMKVDILDVSSNRVTLQAGASTESDDQFVCVPVGGAHVYYLPNEGEPGSVSMDKMSEETYQGCTGAYGHYDLEFDSAPDDGGAIVITSGYATKTITFSEISDLEPEGIEVVSQTDNELVVAVRGSGGGQGEVTIEANGSEKETDENGIAVFDLTDIDPVESNETMVYELRASNGSTLEVTSESNSDSEYRPIVPGEFEEPIEKARILINLIFVLLHSVRIVYAEFGIPNKQYKIDIFQSLNDRGEDLDIRDIIRARVIAKEVDNVEDWSKIDDRFDGTPEDIENFLKQYITAQQGLTKPDSDDVKSLFALNEATVGDAESILSRDVTEAENMLARIETYSKRYKEISEAKLPPANSGLLQGFTREYASEGGQPGSEERYLRRECEALLEYLNEVGKVWEPFVLGLYYKFAQTDGRGEQFNAVLKNLVKIIYRYTPYGEGISSSIARTYLHDMAKILVEDQLNVHDSDVIIEKLRSNLPDELELEDVARRFTTRRNWQTDTVKSLYTRHIDIKLSERGADGQYITQQFERTTDDNLTIEHIFPSSLGLDDNMSRPKQWLDVYFDSIDSDSLDSLINELEPDGDDQDDDIEKVRQKFVNEIGNMIPLIHAENASASDRLFSKKLTYYFLTGMTDMKNTEEYLYNKHPLAKIVPLVEVFIDESDYCEEIAAKILGCLVENGDTAQQETISEALVSYELDANDIESTELDTKINSDSTVKEKIRSMLERGSLDETENSAPTIVDEFNRKWDIEATKDRKEHLVREILITLAFEDEYDESDDDETNFGIDIRDAIDEDYKKRIALR